MYTVRTNLENIMLNEKPGITQCRTPCISVSRIRRPTEKVNRGVDTRKLVGAVVDKGNEC